MSDDSNTANGASQKNTEKKPEKRPDFSIQKTPEKELGENMGCAAFGLVLGIICLIAPVGQITMPSGKETHTLNKWGISGLMLGAPITAFSVWGSVSSVLAAKQARQKRLRRAFFELLEQSEGRLNLITFSRAVDIDGNEAKAYLNARAQEFNALFEPGTDGGITYFFDL